MLKRIRLGLAAVFWLGITLLFLDGSGVLRAYLGWMAKIQLLPAVLAVNVAVIAGLVLLTLVFGRIYCSVICPLGVLQDGISHLGTRGSKAPYRYRKEIKWLRYGVWAAYIACLLAGVHAVVILLAPYGAYGRMVNNLFGWADGRAVSWVSLAVAVGSLLVVGLLAWKGGRSYCNSICPVGTTLGLLSRFAMFRPVINRSKCQHCKACELHCKAQCIEIGKDSAKIDYSRCVDCFNCLDKCSFGALEYKFAWKKTADQAEKGARPCGNPDPASRRAFLAGTAVAAGTLALKGPAARAQLAAKKVDGGLADVLPKQAPERSVPITPPGSESVQQFYRNCVGCQLCIAACPNKVLRPSLNPEQLMQPEMGYEKGWCRPECTRCSEVCPTGSIRKITREEKTQYHIGVAGVNAESCLLAKGEVHCGKCASICPTGAVSIIRQDGRQLPTVAEQICIGCGACEQYCPVRPLSAITVNGKFQHRYE